MGFLKDLGKGLGQIAGGVVGGTINLVGEITDSKALKEIGEGVYHASSKAGETLGTFASGAVDVVGGIVSKDDRQIENGFGDMGSAVNDTYQGVKAGVINVIDNGGKVIEGLKNDDFESVKQGGTNLIKTAAIATFAVGVADFIGVVGDDGVIETAESHEVTDTDVHEVKPHWVNGYERAEGTYVEGYWRDGDGNTSVNLTEEEGGGYLRSNPDGMLENNLHLDNGTIQPGPTTTTVENPNTHHVASHWVNGYERADGTHVDGYWRDGDGDTTKDTNGGWTQHNPDYKTRI
ncbi:hypothetical protein ABHN11_12840 [Brevibacillus centrosporus]|uniref:hypothetical protein n=1 Tax=Brevibacillus centrosporus TaxID=54910 RepID=UPI003D22B7F6